MIQIIKMKAFKQLIQSIKMSSGQLQTNRSNNTNIVNVDSIKAENQKILDDVREELVELDKCNEIGKKILEIHEKILEIAKKIQSGCDIFSERQLKCDELILECDKLRAELYLVKHVNNQRDREKSERFLDVVCECINKVKMINTQPQKILNDVHEELAELNKCKEITKKIIEVHEKILEIAEKIQSGCDIFRERQLKCDELILECDKLRAELYLVKHVNNQRDREKSERFLNDVCECINKVKMINTQQKISNDVHEELAEMDKCIEITKKIYEIHEKLLR